MPTLNMRLSKPDLLIDINRLDALEGISVEDDMVRIGALTRHTSVLQSPIVAKYLPLIAEAMPHVAHVAVRNRGTFGGSIALADPAAELPACALALNATIVVESVRGPGGGYRLARPAAEIRVAEILGAVDETVSAMHKGAGVSGGASGSRAQSLTNRLWEGLSAHGGRSALRVSKARGAARVARRPARAWRAPWSRAA